MTDTVLSARNGRVGHIQLNRPEALNALTLDMIVALHKAMDEFAADPEVEALLLTSTSPKAFCAGGDIKAVRQSVIDGTNDGFEFFDTEYKMNAAIANYPKPYASVLFGATMGGGMGVSVHGTHRIVTEKLMAAKPETAIGFIPDVGASWALPRHKGGVPMAIYLGATGYRVGAADALYLGIGTHLIDDAAREDFTAAVAEKGLDAALAEFAKDPATAGTSEVEQHAAAIEDVFSRDTAAQMLARLDELAAGDNADAEWAKATADALRAPSPTSVVATIELMRHGATVSTIEDALAAELRLGQWITHKPDFIEGVRAVLVDKTRDADWQPKSFDDVDVAAIRQALQG